MTTLRDGSKENRESFEREDDKLAKEKVAEQHERKESADVLHAEKKDARYEKEAFEQEKKDIEG